MIDLSEYELKYTREGDHGYVYATYRKIGYQPELATAEAIRSTLEILLATYQSWGVDYVVAKTMTAFASRADPELVRSICTELITK